MILSSHALLEPARQLAKTLDQGLGAVDFGHPGLDVAEPSEIGLARLLAQGKLGVLQFPNTSSRAAPAVAPNTAPVVIARSTL
ncbi:hypothetical protein KXX24_008069 [Aspergillus fumigatus]|nr:hypothetical protein KXX24_008069 [Aspergillus fumigatus]